MVYASLFGLSC